MIEMCKKCSGKCCEYFCFEIDEPDTYDEFEDIRWFLCHADVSVHVDEGDWYISIANRCNMLDENNRCTIYTERPIICRNYDLDTCDATPGGYDYDDLFNSPADIVKYARHVLGDKAYEKAEAKLRAKADGKPRKRKAKAIKHRHGR